MTSETDHINNETLREIAHQIRSPISTLRLALKAVLEDGDNLTADQKLILTQAVLRTERVFELSSLILRSDADLPEDNKVEKVPGSVEQLIDEILDEFKFHQRMKDLEVKLNYANNRELVNFDADLLKEALYNLLDNAAKYTKPGGTISISTTYNEHEIEIELSDTGIGVEEAEAGKLFRKFSRLNNAKSMYHDGIGLGLYIAKRAVEKNGGQIRHEANKPMGSNFIITLPK